MSRNWRNIGILLALVIWVNLFLFQPLAGTGLALFLWGVLCLVLAVFVQATSFQKMPRFQILLLIVALFGAGVLVIRAAPVVIFLITVLMLGLVFLLTYLLASRTEKLRAFGEVIAAPFLFLKGWVESFATWPKVTDSSGKKENNSLQWRRLVPVLVGVMVGIPLVLLLSSLLASADPVYSQFVRHLVHWEVPDRVLVRVLVSAIAVVMFGPLLVMRLQQRFVSPLAWRSTNSALTALNTVLVMVLVLLAVFLAVQWPYVFARVAAETDLSQFGVATYSEYVTKGFSELIVVAVIIYGVLGIHMVVWRGNLRKSSWGRVLATGLVLLFGVFILSVFRRVWLYQLYHGMSLIRVYGLVFLLGVAGMGGLLYGRYWKKTGWFSWEMGFVLGLFVLIGLWNVEQFIARVDPPTVNGQVDYVYLSRMSADGYVGWMKAFDWAEKVVNSDLAADGLVDSDERRQLAYAGMVLGNLDTKQVELTKKYGNSEELFRLWSDQLSLQMNIKEVQIDVLEQRLPTIEEGGETYNRVVDIRNKYEEKLSLQASTVSEMSPELVEEGAFAYDPASFYSRGHLAFDINASWCIDGVCLFGYELRKVDEVDMVGLERSWWQKLVAWNWSEKRAYTSWQEDVGQVRWDEVMNLWIHWYGVVLMQPENERSYDRDISVTSPLL